MKIDVDGYLSSQWEQHCRWEEEGAEMSIDDLANKAWNDYEIPKELVKLVDDLTDTQYFLCGDMFAEGFKAGIAHILAKGKPNE